MWLVFVFFKEGLSGYWFIMMPPRRHAGALLCLLSLFVIAIIIISPFSITGPIIMCFDELLLD